MWFEKLICVFFHAFTPVLKPFLNYISPQSDHEYASAAEDSAQEESEVLDLPTDEEKPDQNDTTVPIAEVGDGDHRSDPNDEAGDDADDEDVDDDDDDVIQVI